MDNAHDDLLKILVFEPHFHEKNMNDRLIGLPPILEYFSDDYREVFVAEMQASNTRSLLWSHSPPSWLSSHHPKKTMYSKAKSNYMFNANNSS